METSALNVQPFSDLHTPETGKHQDQVKVLIERTASSLDDTALKMLFVSVQQNNIELCIRYVINLYVMFSYCWRDLTSSFFSLTDDIGVINTVCPRHRNSNNCNVEFDTEVYDMVYNVMVRAFICKWMLNSLNWIFTFYRLVTSEYQHTIFVSTCCVLFKIVIR